MMKRVIVYAVGIAVGVGAGCGSSKPAQTETSKPRSEPAQTVVNDEPAVVKAPTPEVAPPVAPAPEVTTATPQVETQDSSTPAWWIEEPVRVSGRLKLAASSEASTMLDARRAAVTAGEEGLREVLEREPADLRIELFSVVRVESGGYRAFVLVSASL